MNAPQPHSYVSRNVLWRRQKLKEQIGLKGEGQRGQWTFNILIMLLEHNNRKDLMMLIQLCTLYSIPNSKGSATKNGERWKMNNMSFVSRDNIVPI